MTLPSRGWGPWRQEFYSLSAFPHDMTAGIWRNVWLSKVSGTIYRYRPGLWRWWMNTPSMRARFLKRMKPFFPNLR